MFYVNLYRVGLFFVLLAAAYTDWKEAKIYNRQVAAGMFFWIGVTIVEGVIWDGGEFPLAGSFNRIVPTGGRICLFFLRMAGTCAILYPLFICRVVGAGDIKLMGLCLGFLGIRDGSFALFLGLVPAGAVAAVKMYREGRLWERMACLASFIGRIGRERKLTRYQIRYQKADLIPLAPFFLIGYGIYLLECL